MKQETKLEAAAPKEQQKEEEQEGNNARRKTSTSSPLPRGGAAVIVGGGVAGTAAAAELCSRRPDARVTLVARDDKVKVATNVVRHTKYIETFEISPVDAAAFAPPNLTIVRGEALSVDLEKKELTVKKAVSSSPAKEKTTTTSNGGGDNDNDNDNDNEGEEEGRSSPRSVKKLPFDVLIAATGAVPKRLLPASEDRKKGKENERIVYLRDADSVAAAALSLRGARRVVVAGNGGIALGLAHALGSSDVVASDSVSCPGEEGGRGDGEVAGQKRRQRRQRRRVLWAAKHGHVGDAFFDADAAAFLARAIGKKRRRRQTDKKKNEGEGGPGVVSTAATAPPPLPTSLVPPRAKATAAAPSSTSSSTSCPASLAFGAAVGPGWVESLTGAIGTNGEDEEEEAKQANEEGEEEGEGGSGIELHLNATVTSVEDNDAKSTDSETPRFPLVARLSDGSPPFPCDAVVAAVGVAPDTSWLPPSLERSPRDGGVLVDGSMRSSVGPMLLACGDACTVRDDGCSHGDRWFQMRLWSQARATGAAAGRFAATGGEDEGEGSPALPPWPHSLELFAHATSVAGLRVILLGLYNGQGLEREPEEDIVTYCREEEGGGEGEEGGNDDGTFVRVLLLRGRLAGAVLVGETGLEGAFEDLIMDGIDVSFLGPRLLDPDLDVEAIFD